MESLVRRDEVSTTGRDLPPPVADLQQRHGRAGQGDAAVLLGVDSMLDAGAHIATRRPDELRFVDQQVFRPLGAQRRRLGKPRTQLAKRGPPPAGKVDNGLPPATRG